MPGREILIIGTYTMDTLVRPVDRLPAPGELAAVERIELQVGGCAANTGVALARLGARVRSLGRVGDDKFGLGILHSMRAEGIDIDAMTVDPDVQTAAAIAMVDSRGERSLLMQPGAHKTACADDAPLDRFPDAGILHFAGVTHTPGLLGEPLAQLAADAKERGLTVTLDTAWDFEKLGVDALAPALPHLDFITPNEAESKALTGLEDPDAMADFFLKRGVGGVAIKLGEKGCLIATANERFRLGTLTSEAVDATGAGDAFAGGFLYGLNQSWPMRKSALLGSATAAACVSALGAQTGLKNFCETIDLIRKNGVPEDAELFKLD